MAPITGTYTQVSSEKYEDFLKALGVGFILRKAALASTPVMTISGRAATGRWSPRPLSRVSSLSSGEYIRFRAISQTPDEFEEDIRISV